MLDSMCATEDAAWRRFAAVQGAVDVAGRATYKERYCCPT
jgi:hypothetical protein